MRTPAHWLRPRRVGRARRPTVKGRAPPLMMPTGAEVPCLVDPSEEIGELQWRCCRRRGCPRWTCGRPTPSPCCCSGLRRAHKGRQRLEDAQVATRRATRLPLPGDAALLRAVRGADGRGPRVPNDPIGRVVLPLAYMWPGTEYDAGPAAARDHPSGDDQVGRAAVALLAHLHQSAPPAALVRRLARRHSWCLSSSELSAAGFAYRGCCRPPPFVARPTLAHHRAASDAPRLAPPSDAGARFGAVATPC